MLVFLAVTVGLLFCVLIDISSKIVDNKMDVAEATMPIIKKRKFDLFPHFAGKVNYLELSENCVNSYKERALLISRFNHLSFMPISGQSG